MTERALVLFSGGQDSATCLAWALERYAAVETIGFDYRQRHRVEIDCRAAVIERLRREFPDWSGKLGDDHIVDLGVLGEISDTALTGDTAIPGVMGAANVRPVSCAAAAGKLLPGLQRELRRQGDFLYAAGRRGADRAAVGVLPLCRLQSVVGTRGRSRECGSTVFSSADG